MKILALDLGGSFVGWATLFAGPGAPADLTGVGTWSIADRNRKESPGVRWIRLRQKLDEALASGRPDMIVYEEVRAHVSPVAEQPTSAAERILRLTREGYKRAEQLPPGDRSVMQAAFDDIAGVALTIHKPRPMNVDAAHAYGAAEGILLAWCAENGLEVKSQPIATVKAAATGKGGGPGTAKEDVLAAARARWGAIHTFSGYDAADAAFIGLAALIELGLAPATVRADGLVAKARPAKKAAVRRSGRLF